MVMFPHTIYTPVKTDDGQGGSTEVLSGGTTIWGVMKIHMDEVQMIVDERESVEVGDIVETLEET